MDTYKSIPYSKNMDQMLILQGITVDEILQKIENIIERKIAELSKRKEEDKNRYMTRKEVAGYLHISLVTLNDWTKLGFIESHKIGNRVLYKADEVEKAVRVRKFHKYQGF